MGGFTTGVLYPSRCERKVLHKLPSLGQPFFHQTVNDEWNAVFLEDEYLQKAETVQFLLQLSRQDVPLLWFHDADDSGWGFRLFDGGCEVASATICYDLDAEMAEEIMSFRYPGLDVTEAIAEDERLRKEYEAVLDEVVTSSRFRQEVKKGIARICPESFACLLSPKQIKQLKSVFDISILTQFDEETGGSLLYDSVDLFKEILGIEEIMWVSFSYLASGGREPG